MTPSGIFPDMSLSSKDGVRCNWSGLPHFSLLLKQVTKPSQTLKEGN